MATAVMNSKKKSQKGKQGGGGGGSTAQHKQNVGCNAEIEYTSLSASYHRKYDTFIKSQPRGFQEMLERMLRAMFLRRPVNICIFFADYLESAVDRRTLAAMEFGGLRFDGKKREEQPEEPSAEDISPHAPQDIPETSETSAEDISLHAPADEFDALDDQPSAEAICMQPGEDSPDTSSALYLPQEDECERVAVMGPISRTDHRPQNEDNADYLDDEMSNASSLMIMPSDHGCVRAVVPSKQEVVEDLVPSEHDIIEDVIPTEIDIVVDVPSKHDSVSEICLDESKIPEPEQTDAPHPSLHELCSEHSTSDRPCVKYEEQQEKLEEEDMTTGSISEFDPPPRAADDPCYDEPEKSQHGSTHSSLKEPAPAPNTIEPIGSAHSDLQQPCSKHSGVMQDDSIHDDNQVQETSAITAGEENLDQTPSAASVQQVPETYERHEDQADDIVAQQAETIVKEAICASEEKVNQEKFNDSIAKVC